MVMPNVCGPSGVERVTVLAATIFRWLLNFWKISGLPLDVTIFSHIEATIFHL